MKWQKTEENSLLLASRMTRWLHDQKQRPRLWGGWIERQELKESNEAHVMHRLNRARWDISPGKRATRLDTFFSKDDCKTWCMNEKADDAMVKSRWIRSPLVICVFFSPQFFLIQSSFSLAVFPSKISKKPYRITARSPLSNLRCDGCNGFLLKESQIAS